jgi:hypothetical protein
MLVFVELVSVVAVHYETPQFGRPGLYPLTGELIPLAEAHSACHDVLANTELGVQHCEHIF